MDASIRDRPPNSVVFCLLERSLFLLAFPPYHKVSGRERSIPLNTSARTALAEYVAPLLQVDPTLKAVARVWSSHPNGPLWISQKGGPLSVSAIGRMIDELVRSSRSLPGEASAHWLRHTFATRYL